VKKIIATAGAVLVISPLIPFYVMTLIGDAAHRWAWPHRLCDLADRVEAWGHK
jgi:hypothetical protein